MDLSPIITQAFSSLWYLIPLFLFVGLVKSSWFKGVMGEFIVNVSARLFLDKDQYHLIKNVTLPTEDGTTQIDHIIVSEFGVFVVETKNMKGWIFGRPNQKQWTQKIYRHSKKFQNPLHQNHKHLKTLQGLLDLKDSQMHSVVVFIGDSTFKTALPDNVTYGGGYIRYIKSKNISVLSPYDVTLIIKKIEAGRFTRSFKTNRDHVRHVKEIVKEKENSVSCPKCGGDMVKREVKKGERKGQQFWGCSQYPKCRGIVNVSS